MSVAERKTRVYPSHPALTKAHAQLAELLEQQTENCLEFGANGRQLSENAASALRHLTEAFVALEAERRA